MDENLDIVNRQRVITTNKTPAAAIFLELKPVRRFSVSVTCPIYDFIRHGKMF